MAVVDPLGPYVHLDPLIGNDPSEGAAAPSMLHCNTAVDGV